jgi:putative copper resistance protein D
VGVAGFALAGPPAAFDTTLFWVHMAQHLLLVMVAAPLILLGAPVTLALRTNPRGRLRSLVGARPIRTVSHPVVAWASLAAVMVVTHFSVIYDAALENEVVHIGEHTLYVSAALLFWWPIVGLDPGSHRLAWPLRAVYIALTMPLQAFIGLALYSSDRVLYQHYATLQRTWGPTPLEDQQLAGVVMWVGGELVAVAALAAVIVAWMGHEERLAAKEDRRLGLT